MAPLDEARRLVTLWREQATRFELTALRTADVLRARDLRLHAQTMRECARFVDVFVLGNPSRPCRIVRHLSLIWSAGRS